MFKAIALTPAALAAALCGFFGIVSIAYAADLTAPTPTIDFSPVLLSIIGLAAAAITALGGIGVKAVTSYLDRKFGLQLDADTRTYLDQALFNAVSFAEHHARDFAQDKAQIEVRNRTLAYAMDYMLDRVPDALAHFGITEQALKRMIEARLGYKFTAPNFAVAEVE